MPRGSKNSLAFLAYSEFELGQDREPPTEFCLFQFGEIQTDKGTFVFDEEAAASVMADYAKRGKTLMADYEHQSLQSPPVIAPGSATEWVPEIRNGELWATAVRWTERAAEFLRSGEYRFFSPAFLFNEATGVIRSIVNFALTNNPATWGLSPLVAASSFDTNNEGEVDMAECTTCAALTSEGVALRAQLASLTAKLSAFEEKEKEKGAELTALSAFRSGVFAAIGKANEGEALGALTALQGAKAELARLTAEREAEKAAALSAKFSETLSSAISSDKAKIYPAQRGYWEGIAKSHGTELALSMLTGFLDVAQPILGTPATQPAAAASVSTAAGLQLSAAMGVDEARFQAWRATQAAGA